MHDPTHKDPSSSSGLLPRTDPGAPVVPQEPTLPPHSLDPLAETITQNEAGGPPPDSPTMRYEPALPVSSPAGYAIFGELGRGGMGVVYKARQTRLNRVVALKMILAGEHAGGQELARFRTEAEAVARLQHPNIVQIHEVGEHNGLPYFSLEFVDGGSLAAKLRGTPLPPAQAAGLVEVLARAMHYAHQHGVVHRDLKPANILLQRSEVGGQRSEKQTAGRLSADLCPLTPDLWPKITDFGLAKRLDTETGQTQSGAILGTPSYMAPEQAGGKGKEVGPAADVYALGAMLYECLTGRSFSGPTRRSAVLPRCGTPGTTCLCSARPGSRPPSTAAG